MGDLTFFVDVPLGCYLGLVSYNGFFSMTAMTSKKADADASAIAKHWVPAFEQLEKAVTEAQISKVVPRRQWGNVGLWFCAAVMVGYALQKFDAGMLHT